MDRYLGSRCFHLRFGYHSWVGAAGLCIPVHFRKMMVASGVVLVGLYAVIALLARLPVDWQCFC